MGSVEIERVPPDGVHLVVNAEPYSAPGVTVVATPVDGQGAKTVWTDLDGRYRINDVPIGAYSVAFYQGDSSASVANTVRANEDTDASAMLRVPVEIDAKCAADAACVRNMTGRAIIRTSAQRVRGP